MQLLAYFKIIRWKNLLFIAYTLYILKFQLFTNYLIDTKLAIIDFFLLLISVLCITAAGYIINDIFDVTSDKINKPQKLIISKFITIEKAQRWYLFTNAIGLALGLFLCLKVQKPTFSFLFIGTSLLLYFYSKSLKSKPLVGNLIVAILTALSFSLLAFFDLKIEKNNTAYQIPITAVLILVLFAFILNLIREMVKDIEDIDGDYKAGLKTLPILLGRDRFKIIVSYLCYIPILALIIFSWNYAEIYKFTSLYLILLVCLPLFYVALKLKSITSKKEFHRISTILKIIMFLGVNSIIVFTHLH